MVNIPQSYKYRYNGVIHTGPSIPDGAELIETTDILDKQTYNILSLIYPVGSIYIGTQSTCPMETLISGSTWELVANGRVLQGGDGTNANTTVAAGLPNITGSFNIINHNPDYHSYSGAFLKASVENYPVSGIGNGSLWNEGWGKITERFDASNSNSIYGNSNTVQPPAYRVNVWRRTA